MSNKKYPLVILKYGDWIVKQRFESPDELHQHVSRQTQEFLQFTAYPMFYNLRRESEYRDVLDFPLVLDHYSSKDPKFVIDNEYFTIVFFEYDNYDDEMCWEVSVHIKDHDFCDIPIKDFKEWYRDHYSRLFAEMENMPKRFRYPALDVYSQSVDDFCIEFWNRGRDFMLFKLFDLLRIF